MGCVLPICDENSLFSYLANHCFLKKLLIKFISSITNEYPNKNVTIIHWADDISFFGNSKDVLHKIYFLLINFLRKEFSNIEINESKTTFKKCSIENFDENSIDVTYYKKINKEDVIRWLNTIVDFTEQNNSYLCVNYQKEFKLKFPDFNFLDLINSIPFMELKEKAEILSFLDKSVNNIDNFLLFNIKYVIKLLSFLDISKSKYGLNLIFDFIKFERILNYDIVNNVDVFINYSLLRSFKILDSLDKNKCSNSYILKLKDFYSYCYKYDDKLLKIYNLKCENNIIMNSALKLISNYNFFYFRKHYSLVLIQLNSIFEFLEILKKSKYKCILDTTALLRNNITPAHPGFQPKNKKLQTAKEYLNKNNYDFFDLFYLLLTHIKNII